MTAYRYVAAQAPLVCAARLDYDRRVSRLAGFRGRVRDVTALAFSAATACISRDQLVCEDDSQCSRSADGVCHEGGCAYPDADCPSGLRTGAHASCGSGSVNP